ncbi:MAG: ECF transporter S component [Ruminococcaceae bacterium]|nr:ECF transporter S component [Oscillospiraceae bacterium]
MSTSNEKTKKLARLAIIIAIQLILTFTPFIGYIPLGFTRATIIHIPVIIGSLLLGPGSGAVLGFVFGLTSLYTNTFSPTITSFVFTPFYSVDGNSGNLLSLVICFVPRILVGVVPYYALRLLKKTKLSGKINYAICGLLGSLTNTLLVMNMIYLFFGESYGAVKNIAADALYSVILSVIFINGVPEAIVAALLTSIVVSALSRKSQL